MKILIVHAHPEPKSFNGALTRLAQETLAERGHEVIVSDLYATRWDPVSGPRFVGFNVIPPFIAWGPARASAEERQRCLDAYRERLITLETTTPIAYPSLADHDETFRRKG